MIEFPYEPEFQPQFKVMFQQETVESCLAALRMAVVDGKVVSGGGCLEAWAASFISRLITTDAHLLTVPGSVTPQQILKVISSIYSNFLAAIIKN